MVGSERQEFCKSCKWSQERTKPYVEAVPMLYCICEESWNHGSLCPPNGCEHFCKKLLTDSGISQDDKES